MEETCENCGRSIYFDRDGWRHDDCGLATCGLGGGQIAEPSLADCMTFGVVIADAVKDGDR